MPIFLLCQKLLFGIKRESCATHELTNLHAIRNGGKTMRLRAFRPGVSQTRLEIKLV